ncbi:O-methyltransferase [Poritiphilus flavus]|uniref:Methyltransferase domain-containing protein n=1 Tax=Poritiphilus flavus TaxID=2697053 RepID=A0A6L9EFJ3_9FLAO|nr:class I SAM-dependent methyltransferase [Poritiphilus flavus]NAS13550.1 methyltransferase domain-containing protein [Poritiphilus flavus]
MNDIVNSQLPELLLELESKCKEIGFTMPSDRKIGSLLRTLITSKPNANLLELGTGIGLSLCWMVEGMDSGSRLTTIDNDAELIDIAKNYFGADQRLNLLCTDGSEWLKHYKGEKFDLIFADAWPGKYSETEIALDLLKAGGFYVIDDMTLQPNWPEGHQDNVNALLEFLETRKDLVLTRLHWSSGVIIATKRE